MLRHQCNVHYAFVITTCALLVIVIYSRNCYMAFVSARYRDVWIASNSIKEKTVSFINQTDLILNGESTFVLNISSSAAEAEAAYFRFVSHLHAVCQKRIRVGNVDDGGWDLCLAGPFTLRKPCLVYSFGINWDFSFDDSISEKFGCIVRAFDPSMSKATDHVRNHNIWFYKVGLGGNDTTTREGWPVMTLQSIVNRLNDSAKIIDYLKIDIENNEWDSLHSIYMSDILNRVKQLAIEIHILPIGTTDAKVFYDKWTSLRMLESFGFRRWYSHLNKWGAYKYGSEWRSCCYEMVYLNMNFMRSASPRSFAFVVNIFMFELLTLQM